MVMFHILAVGTAVLIFARQSLAVVVDQTQSADSRSDIGADFVEVEANLESALAGLQRLATKTRLESGPEMQKRKNEFVRFGRSIDFDDTYGEYPTDLVKRKNEFVRFGKRKNEFVRFGRTTIDLPRVAMDKRKNEFVRFG